MRRLGALVLCLCAMALVHALDSTSCAAKAGQVLELDASLENNARQAESYTAYLSIHANAQRPLETIFISGGSFTHSTGADIRAIDAFQAVHNAAIWSNQSGNVSWEVDVKTEGLYSLELLYYPLEGKRSKIELGLKINGTTPFPSAEKLLFHRRFADVMTSDGDFPVDFQGNQMPPAQVEAPVWMKQSLSDMDGFQTEPYAFYFQKGINEITLIGKREPLVIGGIRLYQPIPSQPYSTIVPDPSTVSHAGYIQKIQAERPSAKSDPFLRAEYDLSSPMTEPYNPYLTMRNTIGGTAWNRQSQWLEWEFTVPETGAYQFITRYRQNTVRGFFTSRKMTLNGETPFEEMNRIRFNYGSNWQVEALGGQKPFLFHLEKGQVHVLRLEVTSGEMAAILGILNDVHLDLSTLYRKILMITGASPDLYRDYELQKEIPNLLDSMLTAAETLEEQVSAIESMSGFTGTEAVLLSRVADQLRSFVQNPYSIPERLGNFRENVSGLAAWIMSIKEQPLELDYIAIASPDVPLPRANAGLMGSLWHDLQSFMASFVVDYNSIGTQADTDEVLEVWIGTGADQLLILRQLVDQSFFAQTGIPVRLKLVPPSLLVQAIIAGIGPDVAINVSRNEPVNLALRGALEPLDNYPGFDDTVQRFMPTATVPYRFQGKTYAMPETQVFNMMFIRTDILSELEIDYPRTWDDLYEITPILQKNNMEAGLPLGVFNMLLLQNNGTYYNDDHTALSLDSPVANRCFVEWVQFYTQYGYSLFKDDYNRFRTGEMPITIMPYPFFNQLYIAAPEIVGRWAMVPIPGTVQEDGTVSRADSSAASSSSLGSGTCSILLADSKKKQEGWKFLDWWSSAETQAQFGLAVEESIGVAARYPTANIKAFNMLPWTTGELSVLTDQWASIEEIPEVPGGYYTSRNLDNAFRASVYRLENPREMLRYWNRETNKEIRRKLEEYHLWPE